MPKNSKICFYTLLPIVVIGILTSGYFFLAGESQNYTIKGTVTWLDVPNHRASFEYISPRKGTLREMTSQINPDCDIQINGQKASLSDLKPGDVALINARVNKKQKDVQPLFIRVERKPKTTTQPVTTTQPETKKS